jgi:hypothetical protein
MSSIATDPNNGLTPCQLLSPLRPDTAVETEVAKYLFFV